LTKAPLSEVAQVANHQLDEIMNILKSSGIQIEDKEQTIWDIAIKNQKSSMDILNVVF
jgi:hypothetical protein